MNPGPAEEAGKVATTFMDVMRSQPMTLAIIVSNFALLGYLFWSNHEFIKQRENLAVILAADKQRVDALLANCVPLRDMEEMLKTLKPPGGTP